MKTGKTLQAFAQEVQRQQENKRDFLIPASRIQAFAHENHIEVGFPIENNTSELFTAPLTDNGHKQFGNYCNIPSKYYQLMVPHPSLLATNMNHWLARSKEIRTVRSLDGKVRALLSDKFRRLDNFDLAQNVLPMLHESGATIESCELTEKRLYIKAITHKVQAEVKKGDVVSAGIIIQNSETGHGAVSVKPLIYRLVCQNGAVVDDLAMRKYHAGRQNELQQIEFSNEALNAEDKALWLKVRDLVKHSLSEATFNQVVDVMRESTEKQIRQPNEAIELAAKRHGLSEDEKGGVLFHLIQGGDLSAWGLGNAVTRTAQDSESYDRSTELESIGYQIMKQNWN